MSEEIIKVLDNLGQKFGIAIDWTSQNVMPYLQGLMQRYIKYSITNKILGTVVLIVFSIIVGIVLCKTYKKYKEEKEKDRWYDGIWYNLSITFAIILGILIIMSIICIPLNIEGIIQDIYVPELTIIDEIKYINM